MIVVDRCKTCDYFVEELHTYSSSYGICHRYPQEIKKSGEDWCGEYHGTTQRNLDED